MCKNNRQNGFTLIEVMISMLIFAVISLISYNAMQTYATHQKLSFGHFEKINALQKMNIFIKRDMNQIFNQTIALKSNILAFESLQNDNILKIRYLAKDDNLVREEVMDDEITALILIKNIKKFKIRLLNGKDKWLVKYDKKNQYIKAMSLNFESDYWGKIKQLAVVGE